MAKKSERIFLDCGISAERWISAGVEWIRFSLIDVYQGYGEMNNLAKLSELFKELSEKGYTGKGMSTERGYYDSVEDIYLDVSKPIK